MSELVLASLLEYLCFVNGLTTGIQDCGLEASPKNRLQLSESLSLKVLTLSLYFMLPSAFFILNVFANIVGEDKLRQALTLSG